LHQLVRRLERIHALKEREKQVHLAGIEYQRAEAGRELETLEGRLNELRGVEAVDVGDLARRQLYQVQMEMVRRRNEEDMQALDREAEGAREEFQSARRTTQTTAKLAEKLEARHSDVVTRKEARELDEMSAMTWWSKQGDSR
jgi:flagellar biosynthesis chaperone FliJ